MENSKAMMAVSSPSVTKGESELTSLLYDLSQQLQIGVNDMLKMTSETDKRSSEVTEEIEKCKESVGVKSKMLEEDKERFQKAAIAVLEMLNGR